jgi:penicillin amidase
MEAAFPVLKRFLLFIILPFTLLSAGLFLYGRLGLPPREQILQVSGGRTVKIVRDEHGVPHLFASTDDDVYFAMGYVQAQDRLWQLELERRLAAGRLSELFGRDLLSQDSWMRTLGLRQSAASAYTALSEPARRSLAAYARGVNTWIGERHVLPVEFAMFSVNPQPWSEIDSLSWAKVFALSLAGNLDQELGKAVAARYLGPEQVQFFFSGRYGTKTSVPSEPAVTSLASLGALTHDLHVTWQVGGREVGSNAWVISGRYTSDGSAILANDPHLGLQMPSAWYPVVQNGDRLHAQGMALVGLPPVIFGQNGRVAWGGTNMMADVQDLAIERFNPNAPDLYRADDRWLTVEHREEEIEVAPAFPSLLHEALKPVRIEVRRTRNGPLVNDVRGGAAGEPMALRWTALRDGDRSYDGMYAASYADDWGTFREAFRNYTAPALNMLYADRAGNIGYLGVGEIPLRPQGDGSLPVPGWDPAFAWHGSIPFDSMPTRYNPPEGFIVSANNRPVDDAYPYFISKDWAPPARADRIKQLLHQVLASDHPVTLRDMMAIQTDLTSLSAQRLLPRLVALSPENERERQALDVLRTWTGSMDASSAPAALYSVWMRHLATRLFAGSLADDWAVRRQQDYLRDLLNNATADQIARALEDKTGTWCSYAADKDDGRACSTLLRLSLNDALDELRRSEGADPSAWRWGAIHHTALVHRPLSGAKGLAWFFGRRIESGGGPDSVAVSAYVFSETEGYVGVVGPSSRQLIELGPGGARHMYMNSTGQSGNLMSPHYADMVTPLVRGEYYILRRDEEEK